MKKRKEILKIKKLNVEFPIFGGILQREVSHVHAVKKVSFELYKGETLGIVGESGSGKSTLGNAILNVLQLTAPDVKISGRINLKNVRRVHIMEPYWHPVRVQQVVGRARRICSHSELPKELQTVNVFLYLMKFSDTQLESDSSIELRLKDKSKRDKSKVLTSDQFLNEISEIINGTYAGSMGMIHGFQKYFA